MRSSAAKLMCTSAPAATTEDISRMRGRVRIWKYTAPEPGPETAAHKISHKKTSAAPRSADRRYADPGCRTAASKDAMPVLYFFGLSSLWMLQFLLFRTRHTSTPVKTAPISRLGMLFQVFGYWAIEFLRSRRRYGLPQLCTRRLPFEKRPRAHGKSH